MADETPEYNPIPEADQRKAKAFFDKGNVVEKTGNYDYAIEMYLSGLNIDPDAVDAHQTLRDISMKRKATGGKAAGMMDKMKLGRPSKDDKQNLLNQEKLLAMDPGSTDHMVGVLQNALRGRYYETVLWMGPILQKANADSPKPDVKKFIVLRDAYKILQKWKLAADACQYACLLRPDDMDLQNEYRHIAAQQAITAGSYDQNEGFRKSQKNAEQQDTRNKEHSGVQTADMMAPVIKAAEAEWKADPHEPAKIGKYVDALVKTEQPDLENKAIELLQQNFDRSKQFRFRLRIGQIRMQQMKRMERSLRANVNSNPQDNAALQSYKQFAQEKLQEELSEYQLAYENYPTSSEYKWEAAIRLVELRRFDDSIPLLQQLRNDPKWKFKAGGKLGLAFLQAGFVDESIDTLASVLGDYPARGDAESTDMTYIYGRALEQKGEKQAAVKAYSQVAQANFNYKDVRQRITKIQTEMKASGAAPVT